MSERGSTARSDSTLLVALAVALSVSVACGDGPGVAEPPDSSSETTSDQIAGSEPSTPRSPSVSSAATPSQTDTKGSPTPTTQAEAEASGGKGDGPATFAVEALEKIDWGQHPNALAFYDEWIWITGSDHANCRCRLARIDPDDGSALFGDNIGRDLLGIAGSQGSMWVASPSSVYRVDPATLEPDLQVDLPGEFLVADDTAIWVYDRSNLTKLDPSTGETS